MTRPETTDHSHQLVQRWMRPNPAPVGPETTVRQALGLMLKLNVWHLLVMAADRLVGVVTEGDLRRPDWQQASPATFDQPNWDQLYWLGHDLRVRDVMTEQVITIAPDATVVFAATRMVDEDLNCLPVVEGGRVVGMVTRVDMLAALVAAAER